MKACCGFGHKTVLENIDEAIYNSVLTAIQKGCEVFYTGAMGEFDMLFASAVRKAKRYYPHIKLICVRAYFSNRLNKDKEFYFSLYDDIIIPPKIVGIHYKAAIKARNRWMADNCDLIISYIIRDYGGAAEAVKYARRNNKMIINTDS